MKKAGSALKKAPRAITKGGSSAHHNPHAGGAANARAVKAGADALLAGYDLRTPDAALACAANALYQNELGIRTEAQVALVLNAIRSTVEDRKILEARRIKAAEASPASAQAVVAYTMIHPATVVARAGGEEA